MDKKSVNFIIWGIRNGFRRNWMTNISPPREVMEVINDDMRQICNTTIDKFYSIEIAGNYSMISVFLPNTRDHVGRKAYIAISLYFEEGLVLREDPVALLDKLADYYIDKQGMSMVSQFTEDMFLEQIGNPLLMTRPLAPEYTDSKFGHYAYRDRAELVRIFNDLYIDTYTKILFHSGHLNMEQIPEYETITKLEKPIEIKISNYAPDKYYIKQNDHRIEDKPAGTFKLWVKKSDNIVAYHKINNKVGPRVISTIHGPFDFNFIFPPKRAVKKTSSSSNEEKGFRKIMKKIRPFLLPAAAVIIGVLAVIFYPKLFGEKEKREYTPCDPNKVISDITQYPGCTFSFTCDSQLIYTTDKIKWERIADSTNMYYLVDSLFFKPATVDEDIIDKSDSIYIVKEGDKFEKIADSYDIPKEDLEKWNKSNIPNTSEIKPGDTIFLYKREVNETEHINENVSGNINNVPPDNNGVDCEQLERDYREAERIWREAPQDKKDEAYHTFRQAKDKYERLCK